MSMISNINIKKHLGKNIAIYPFDPSKIEGASLDLTASGFAWSANKKKENPYRCPRENNNTAKRYRNHIDKGSNMA